MLAPQETDQLFEELIHLKEQGHTIVFISHKIPEIKKISDRITVMRSSRSVGCYRTEDVTEQQISSLIMGCEMDTTIEKTAPKPGELRIEVENLSYTDRNKVQVLKNVGFGVRSGMIFGIAGVQGNGQVELIDLMTRKRAVREGDIRLNGTSIKKLSIQEIRKMQFGYVPEDRIEQGIAGQESIAENMVSNRYATSEFCRGGLLDYKKIEEFADENIQEYEIRCSGNKQKVGMLSGGNIQKVVVAREFTSGSNFILANQPTRGIDVGAAEMIRKTIVRKSREEGTATLLISADLNEVLECSDRLLVFRKGKVVAAFPKANEVSEAELGEYMLGLKTMTAEEMEGLL